MQKIIEKYPLLSLFLVFTAMLLVHLDVPTLSIMEARNFITAREMIQDGNWIFTTLNGAPRYQKPPLPTWITAFSALIFGIKSIYWLRFPAACMVFFTSVIGYYFSLEFKLSKAHSLRNGLILLTSFYIFVIFSEAPWDIFAHGFMFAGIYFLYLLLSNDSQPWKHSFLAAIFIGFSILSKGPVSLYILLIPFGISYGISYKTNLKQQLLPLISALLLALAIGSSWYFYIWLQDPENLLTITTQESSNWSSYNVKPFYYYWNFFIQSGIWTLFAFMGLIYPYMIKRVAIQKHYKFTFWWTLISLVLLSIVPEKKVRYVMPILIPLALNTGFYVEYLIQNFKKTNFHYHKIPALITFGIIGLTALISPILIYSVFKENIDTFFTAFIIFSIALICTGILILWQLKKKNLAHIFYLTILFVIVLFLFGMPMVKPFKNNSPEKIAKLNEFEKKHQVKTYSIRELTVQMKKDRDFQSPEFLWYYGKNIQNIYKNKHLQLPKEASFGLLLLEQDIEAIQQKLQPNYSFKHIETYNLNTPNKTNNRLIRQFYLVSKK